MTREEAIQVLKSMKSEESYNALIDLCNMAIEALHGDMYCPNCGARLVPENEYLEPIQTHGRLIDADLLMKELSDIQPYNWTDSEAEIQEEADYSLFKSLINSAPTVQADRPHGEWIKHKWAEEFDGLLISNYECTNCHSWERNNTDFCPNCGADMRKEKE